MSHRFDHMRAWPEGYKAMVRFHLAVHDSGLEHSLLELVKVRASQVNGCAFCVDMHTKDARALGETEQRLYLLSTWREAHCYTDRERAALALTEAVTLLADTHVPDDVYEEAAAHFPGDEIAKLVYAITLINAWNRLGVASRAPVGDYQPAASTHAG